MFKKILLSVFCLCTASYAHSDAFVESHHANIYCSSSFNGGATYYDLGVFNGSLWDYIKWDNDKSYSVLDHDLMDAFFKSISGELKEVQIDQVYLSFAQLNTLDCYYYHNFEAVPVTSNDVIASQMKVFADAQKAGKMDPGFNYLKMLVGGFHKYGIKVNLAFGGANAGVSDFVVTEDSAEKLLDVIHDYHIDGIDFDIESGLNETSIDHLKTFFADLYKELDNDKQMTITVMAGIQDWPKGFLKELFDDFNNLFDGVNLMAYSNTEYYLDAVNDTWGMTSWIDIVGKENAHKICLGFFDLVPYEKTAPREERGLKAAEAYLKLASDLKALDYPVNFRAPFWWPAEDAQYHHYQHAKDGSVKFISQDQLTFYQTIF